MAAAKGVFTLFLALCVMGCQFTITRAVLKWTVLDDPEAVCNDYSRAGFFIENTGSSKWIIFLESGGLCYSAETCNRRFFRSGVRTEFATNKDEAFFEFDPDFNLTETWNMLKSLNTSFSRRINPYMTSMSTYTVDDSRASEVEGRDLLSAIPEVNPMFYDFNHVVVPYCSSDLWLAQDDFVIDGVNLASADPQRQFLDNAYLPEADTLQFTFRGQTILRSVIRQLLEKNRLSNATEVLLAGSSAGGLGVVNNIKWIISEFENNSVSANVSVLVDSSWFINFRGNIQRTFDGSVDPNEGRRAGNNSRRADMRLFDLLDSIPQCAKLSPTGSPCCISLDCILLEEEYFPIGEIPIMVISSVYDILLLGEAIARLIPPGMFTSSSTSSLPSLGASFFLTLAEFGGAMNASIINTASQLQGISFAATQCLQHVYFATSTLWDQDGILVDSNLDQFNVSLGLFRGIFQLSIQSGVWSSYDFGNGNQMNLTESCDTSKARTMQEAVEMWYRCRYITDSLQFRDTCHSVHCHNSCPERLVLMDIEANRYPDSSIAIVICLVVFITVASVLTKTVFYMWRVMLFASQDLFILDKIAEEEDDVDGIPQFPVCGLDEAVSVACLDLKYSVTLKKKKVKDEKKDSTSISFAIAHHIEDKEKEENQNLPFGRNLQRSKSTVYTSLMWSEQHRKSRKQLFSGEDGKKDSQRKKLFRFRQSGDSTRSGAGTGSSFSDRTKLSIFKTETKQILKGISTYFNPGELVGIMGPSGCGKTTFLDLLTGRRRAGNVEGEIYINGVPINHVREEYISFTGYVLQLATPYYERLTVRENVTLAAQMKLPHTMTWREKFERVEQVIEVTGLTSVSEIAVGGLCGPGLSGGQKKRLVIALQLLTMPKVIFLDEPTSGLDATASMELLNHLNRLADSNRTVVLTIHQPRFEIFYMFHKLILLSDGKIAYHGIPQKAYGFFVEALMNSFLRKNLDVPQIDEHNPADVIMDMLGKPHFRQIVLDHYQESTEPELIKWAIKRARLKDFQSTKMASLENKEYNPQDQYKRMSVIREPEISFETSKTAGCFNRLATLEARASKNSSIIWRAYLTVIFFLFGFMLGTVYLQQDDPLLIVTAFCVYSVASAIFMFPVMQTYFVKALEVYGYERADGAGRATDLIIQGFSRFTSLSIIPVIIGSATVYLLSITMEFWSIRVYLQLLVVSMALNQTWIALLIFLLCAVPNLAFRLSPVISSVAGFASGFFIPISQTPWWYRWLFFINPNYYGFAAAANILLIDFGECDGENVLECLVGSSAFILRRFNFDQIRPFMNVAILLLMTVVYLLLAALANWLHHTNFFIKLRSRRKKKSAFIGPEESYNLLEEHGRGVETPITEDLFPAEAIQEPSGESNQSIKSAANIIDRRAAKGKPIPLKPLDLQQKRKFLKRQQSRFLDDVEHTVFTPGWDKRPGLHSHFPELVDNFAVQKQQQNLSRQKLSLFERKVEFDLHTETTKEVVKEQTEELINTSEGITGGNSRFRNITDKITRKMKEERGPRFASVVKQAMTAEKVEPSSSEIKLKDEAGTDSTKLKTESFGTPSSLSRLEGIDEEIADEVECTLEESKVYDEVLASSTPIEQNKQ